MKLSLALCALLPLLASAHTIAQRVRVNGADNGEAVGIRTALSNYPIQNVNDANMACNSNFLQPVSSTVIAVKGGDAVGVLWGHVIGGAQYPGDLDQPIASSHKGPVMFYMAKVDNAATASTSGLKWFKVYEDGLDGAGQWGVDRVISSDGWVDFTLPACLAAGDYLLRAEIIALHSAGTQGQAQFYMGCAQLKVSGTGSTSPSSTVSFPGAYQATDPGILVSIYNAQGQPVGNGKPYTIPGPAVLTC
ncbi:lytic polysaccharide monooxygenase [Didymella exigua CBS 183.55]|uniref:AA9 family lytic polysaccharide monooxygenase n=1 Tax=Didymella exigua CBS 183.55 TaxID=1150837 RepID=A0A6A5RKM6_9PLEO|nr:lytic polysaccharide monooxygenase [Didymella exigua CBS 183.55]KAF1928955.1 lytic polysaccharide monooxygenase [Didymella exigua CBS 183.55]